MPRLSDTMTDGTVATWLKNVGDKVEEGDILAEIETDKATMEFECFYEGTILYIGVQEGETTPVDSLLTIIGPEGTDVSKIVANGGIILETNQNTDPEEVEEKATKKNIQPELKASENTSETIRKPLENNEKPSKPIRNQQKTIRNH